MARPSKNYCEYFPHVRDMRNHKKIKALRNKFGVTGYALWSLFLEYLTGNDGNEFEYSEIEFELMAGDFGVSVTEITDVLNYCIKLELLFVKNGFVHSPSLDENLLPVYDKRQQAKQDSKKQLRKNGQFASESTEPTVVTVTEMPQSKVNNSIVDESKKEESKLKENPLPTAGSSESLETEKKDQRKKVPSKKESTPHWELLVETWFTYYESKKGIEPTFEGAQTKALKAILENLQKRSEARNFEWNEIKAKETFSTFLEYAYKDTWLSNNFILTNINSKFDTIIANGKGKPTTTLNDRYSALEAELAGSNGGGSNKG